MTGKFMISYEGAKQSDGRFNTIEEARVLFQQVIATGLYEWVQICDMESGEDFIEEWSNEDYFSEEQFYDRCLEMGVMMLDESTRDDVQKAIDAVAETYSTTTRYEEAKALAKTFYDDYDMGSD